MRHTSRPSGLLLTAFSGKKLLSSLCNKQFTSQQTQGSRCACPFECGGVLPITIHYGSITPATFSVLLSNSLACLALLVGGNRSVSLSTKNSGNRCSRPHHYHWFFFIPKLGFTPIFLKCHLVIFSPACPRHFETFFFLVTNHIGHSLQCCVCYQGDRHFTCVLQTCWKSYHPEQSLTNNLRMASVEMPLTSLPKHLPARQSLSKFTAIATLVLGTVSEPRSPSRDYKAADHIMYQPMWPRIPQLYTDHGKEE